MDKIQPFGQGHIARDQPVPNRRQQQRRQEHHSPHQPQIAAHQRREIIVVGILGKIEQRGGQDHNRRRGVHQHKDLPLCHAGGGTVGALGIPHLGKRVVPLPRHQAFQQTFLPQRQVGDVDALQLAADGAHHLRIGFALDIAQHHIGVGGHPHLHQLHGQMRIAQTAADQRGVAHQRFDEPIPRAAQRPILVRLFHTAGGILPHIHHQCFGKALDHQHRHTRQHPGHQLGLVGTKAHFRVGHKPAGKRRRVLDGFQLLCFFGHQKLYNFFHQIVFEKAIDKIQRCPPLSEPQTAIQQIIAAPDAQRVVQRVCIGGKLAAEPVVISHICPPLSHTASMPATQQITHLPPPPRDKSRRYEKALFSPSKMCYTKN